MSVRCIACGRTLRDAESCPECGTGGEPPALSASDAAIRARIEESILRTAPRRVRTA